MANAASGLRPLQLAAVAQTAVKGPSNPSPASAGSPGTPSKTDSEAELRGALADGKKGVAKTEQLVSQVKATLEELKALYPTDKPGPDVALRVRSAALRISALGKGKVRKELAELSPPSPLPKPPPKGSLAAMIEALEKAWAALQMEKRKAYEKEYKETLAKLVQLRDSKDVTGARAALKAALEKVYADVLSFVAVNTKSEETGLAKLLQPVRNLGPDPVLETLSSKLVEALKALGGGISALRPFPEQWDLLEKALKAERPQAQPPTKTHAYLKKRIDDALVKVSGYIGTGLDRTPEWIRRLSEGVAALDLEVEKLLALSLQQPYGTRPDIKALAIRADRLLKKTVEPAVLQVIALLVQLDQPDTGKSFRPKARDLKPDRDLITRA